MKIYTRTGDSGSTGLFGGPRVAKDDARIEAYGTIDELNALLGTARAAGLGAPVDRWVEQVQSELFSIGAELATPDPDAHHVRLIAPSHIRTLEGWIDEAEAQLPELRQFILPDGTAAATHVHTARAVCRRAERRLVTLMRHETKISDAPLIYLNRLSDLLFVLARLVNHQAGAPETPWKKPS